MIERFLASDLAPSADGGDREHYGDAVLASFLVQLTTFSGLGMTVVLSWYSCCRPSHNLWDVLHKFIIPSFAAGALLATVFFLIIPESMELIGHGHHGISEENDEAVYVGQNVSYVPNSSEDGDHTNRALQSGGEHHGKLHKENDVAWKFGVGIMLGILIPILLGSIFPHHPDEEEAVCEECRKRELVDDCQDCKIQDVEVIAKKTARITAENFVKHQTEEIIKSEKFTNSETLDGNCDVGDCCHEDHFEKYSDDSSHHHHHDDDDHHYHHHHDGYHKENLEHNEDNHHSHHHDHKGDCHEHHSLTSQKNGEHEVAEVNETPDTDDVENAIAKTTKKAEVPKIVNYSLAASILIGDAFHTFTDGIFIGTSFNLCNHQVAYAIVATTIYHEVAQELADFCLLTHHCGLPTWKALLFNYISGFSTLVGAVLVQSLDLSNEGTGILLALSAGVFIYIAGCECIPRVMHSKKHPRDMIKFFVSFVAGTVPIGLVLLNHGHCEDN